MSVESRIETLRQQLREHDHRYYVLNQPTISDREYDQLFDELKKLERDHAELVTPDSPTQRVSETPISGFTQVEHAVPMLSIDNTYNEQELRDFDRRVREGLEGAAYRYMVDPKIDGVACSLVYEDGLLVRAVTRGNGRMGDDVTANMRTLPTVPLRLTGQYPPRFLDVRGEVYWPDEPFEKHNKKRLAEGEEPFANPRNAAAGTLKQLDPRQVAGRGLQFVAHGFAGIDPPAGQTHAEVCDRLVEWGLPVSEHRTAAADIDAVIALTHEWHDRRFKLPYQTDGLVVKVDSLAQREILGTTSRHPRWCIAYKFAPEQAETELLDVEFQVGKTGILTPVARLRPVQLAGTTVSNASLHNLSQIRRLGIAIGDRVKVEKAGEIIPQIVKVLRTPIATPKLCPKCSSTVKFDEIDPGMVGFQCVNRSCEQAFNIIQRRDMRLSCAHCGRKVRRVDYLQTARCVNANCPAQIKTRLTHFASRHALDIEGLGESVATTLIDKQILGRLQDLYDYAKWEGRLLQEKGYGHKTVDQLIRGIETSKSRPLSRFLVGLCIPHVGVATAEVLARAFLSIMNLRTARKRDILLALSMARESRSIPKGKPPVEMRLAGELRDFFSANEGRTLLSDSVGSDESFESQLKRINTPLFRKPSVFAARSKRLVELFDSVADLALASEALLAAALSSEVGIARDVYQFFQNQANAKLIDDLVAAGCKMLEDAPHIDGPFSKLDVVITGTLRSMSRKEAQDLIKSLGGNPGNSVTKTTSLLVAGESSGSKLERAEKLGIEIIDEQEFLRRAGRAHSQE